MGKEIIIKNDSTNNSLLTIRFNCDITISSNDTYFKCESNNIIFDGNNRTFTIENIRDYLGLIENGTSTTSGYSNITIKNFNMIASGTTTLNNGAGYLCRSYFGNTNGSNINIDNCINSGPIESINSGGLVGTNSYIQNISNCTNSGLITGIGAGGICGGFIIIIGKIFNCKGIGKGKLGVGAGAICGQYAGNGFLFNAENCSSTEEIAGEGSGGISGRYTGLQKNNKWIIGALFKNCLSKGNISGPKSGGICGLNSNFIIEKCFSEGEIAGDESGGICGSGAGLHGSSISNSFSTGKISGIGAGGVCGSCAGRILYVSESIINVLESLPLSLTITKCYSRGELKGERSGGICGIDAIKDDAFNIIKISNSYSSGKNSGEYVGGIYADGKGDNAISENTYTAYNSWSDDTARLFLVGAPSLNSDKGEIWRSDCCKDTPYTLV
jgi:hypothetical protein